MRVTPPTFVREAEVHDASSLCGTGPPVRTTLSCAPRYTFGNMVHGVQTAVVVVSI